MSDHKSVTWQSFMDGALPDPVPGSSETLMAVKSLRDNFVPEVLGGFIKWGMPFVKDMVTYSMYESCLQVVRGPEKAKHVTRVPLGKVDWAFLEGLFQEGERAYREYMQRTSGDEHKLKEWLDGLEYALAGRMPGIEKPGDLHDSFMKPPDAN